MVSDVLSAARESVLWMEASASDNRPPRVPYVVDIAEMECNPSELLLGMARSVLILSAGGSPETQVVVEEVGLIPPVGDAFDAVIDGPDNANPKWLSKLQLWSVRAAPFRCDLALN